MRRGFLLPIITVVLLYMIVLAILFPSPLETIPAEDFSLPRLQTPKELKVITNISTFSEKLLAVSLQGIVNRQEPEIYILWSNYSDEHWLRVITDSNNISTEYMTLENAIEHYKEKIRGAIFVGENLHEVNIATMLASINDSIIVTNETVNLAYDYGIPIIENLSWMDSMSQYEIYKWALDNLWEETNHVVLVSLAPTALRMRDFIIALNLFVFYYDMFNATHLEAMREILEIAPKNIPVVGWFNDEYTAVRTVSQMGDFVVPLDFAPNLTVHRGFADDIELLSQKVTSYAIEPSKSEVYITFIISDGDNIQYDINFMLKLWNDPSRGEIPIGWTISPLLIEFAPYVMKFYYENASENDIFVAGPSGAGYVYPLIHGALYRFLALTYRFLKRADLNLIWALGSYPTTGNLYAKLLDLEGIFEGYGSFTSAAPMMLCQETPYFLSNLWIRCDNATSVRDKILEVASQLNYTPKFIFVGLDAWHTNLTVLKEAINMLPENFIVLRPDIFAKTFVVAFKRGIFPQDIYLRSVIGIFVVASIFFALLEVSIILIAILEKSKRAPRK